MLACFQETAGDLVMRIRWRRDRRSIDQRDELIQRTCYRYVVLAADAPRHIPVIIINRCELSFLQRSANSGMIFPDTPYSHHSDSDGLVHSSIPKIVIWLRSAAALTAALSSNNVRAVSIASILTPASAATSIVWPPITGTSKRKS